MNVTLSPGTNEALVFLIGLWGLIVTIFWMTVGWRAMRAHESLAAANRQLVDEVRIWRQASAGNRPTQGQSQAASAAGEERISEVLRERDRNP
jgi:hypothetical protein